MASKLKKLLPHEPTKEELYIQATSRHRGRSKMNKRALKTAVNRHAELMAPRAQGMATYEIALPGGPTRPPMDVVTGLPSAEVCEVLFYQGSFWRVNAIEAATTQEAERRLVVSPSTDEPKSGAP